MDCFHGRMMVVYDLFIDCYCNCLSVFLSSLLCTRNAGSGITQVIGRLRFLEVRTYILHSYYM